MVANIIREAMVNPALKPPKNPIVERISAPNNNNAEKIKSLFRVGMYQERVAESVLFPKFRVLLYFLPLFSLLGRVFKNIAGLAI